MEGKKVSLMPIISIWSLVATLVGAGTPLQIEDTRGFPFASSGHFRKSLSPSADSFRLPLSVLPELYTIRIRPILDENDATGEQFTAPGSVTILVKCAEATNSVTWHKHPNLTITENSVKIIDKSSGDPIAILKHEFEEQNQFYTVTLGSSLVVGQKYDISMAFVAPIPETMEGLYRAKYTTPPPESATKWLATTQFESPFARQAFPCFDEPDKKAKFDISIGRTKNRNSLCNSVQIKPAETDPEYPDYEWDTYDTTVKMSTYLIAMIVSEFKCEEADPIHFPGRTVRVCGPPHLIDAEGGKFAADQSAKILQLLETKFVHKYEMPKMDSVAIPRNYFAAGAMENWGLNTYRDNYLLYYDDESGEVNKQQISSILSHELAHQWFGNLVTCGWWSNIWLNEGFATYISFMYNEVSEEFDTQAEFLWDSVQYALQWDVGRKMPVLNSAQTVKEVDSVFGTNTYDKGGSIIRMMEGFLGKDKLIKALIEYLERNAYEGVVQDQLFLVLQEFAGGIIPDHLTIKDIMDTWTLKSGFPLIRVTKVTSNRVYISQEEFLRAPKGSGVIADNSDRDGELWVVPLAIATANNKDFTNHTPAIWLPKDVLVQSYQHDTSSWIVLNPDAMTFARVLYDDHLLDLIHGQLRLTDSPISQLSKSQILDDYYNFAKMGHATIDKALDLTEHVNNNDEHIVWYTLFTSLTKALQMLSPDSAFRTYFGTKIDSILSTDKFLGDNWRDKKLIDVGKGTKAQFTAKLLDWSCALSSDKCRTFANKLFLEWFQIPADRNQIIPVDYQPIIYCGGVEVGETHNFLLEQYTNNPSDAHKSRFLNAASCIRDVPTLDKYLRDNVLNLNGQCTSNCVSKDHAITALQRAAMNSEGRATVFEILRSEFAAIKTYLGQSAFSNVISTLSTYFNTQPQLDDLNSFITDHQADFTEEEVIKSLQDSRAAVQANIDWMTEFEKPIKNWLANHSP